MGKRAAEAPGQFSGPAPTNLLPGFQADALESLPLDTSVGGYYTSFSDPHTRVSTFIQSGVGNWPDNHRSNRPSLRPRCSASPRESRCEATGTIREGGTP